MKKITFIVFFVLSSFIYSQKEANSQIEIGLTTGISSPGSNFSDTSYASSGNFFELSAAYYFSKLGIGASIGSISNPTEGNFSDFANSQFNDPSLSPTNSTENWKSSYYGVGPEFKTALGSAFEATFTTRIGSMSVKPLDINATISVDNADVPSSIPLVRFGTTETTKLSYYSAGIKLGYKVSDKFGLYFLLNHLSSLSKEITVSDRVAKIPDSDGNGVINREDLISKDGTPVQIDYATTSTTTKPQNTNLGIGLTYSFGKKPKRNNGTEIKTPIKESKNDNISVIKNPVGKITFDNPSKKEDKLDRKIITITPKNNSSYKKTSEIPSFTWKVVGKPIPNANFVLEVIKVNLNRQPERTYVLNTKLNSAKSTELFKENQLSDGNYMWKVTETSTGISSNPSFFSMAPCEINFSISNDTIECLGYEGENRKFKICFDAVYQSNTGNLTYANIGSGLTVFDQTFAALSYTLVAPNPTLITQIGATTTTVSYCFEVVVNNSVTSIGFGLQGDDLDPSPITCQPGVSANFDDLPDCLCDDCEDVILSFDNFTVKPKPGSGNQFNFNGNINVNIPIYAIEFQIQSYNYTANPGPCTAGVTSVEESGMFLMPGTTINNSALIQLFNETVSGSMTTNNNATKDIKYTSTSPLTGPIPVNLTIGLPGPITGLDPSCCVIDYEVCIKVIIFYEDGSCKSCDFTHCFQFNNQ